MLRAVATLVAFVAVPLFYLGTGAVLASFRPTDRKSVDSLPLLGFAFWGPIGLFHLMSGCPRAAIYLFVAMMLGGGAWFRRRELADVVSAWCVAQPIWWAMYVLFVIVLAVSPFPGLWLMGGDWVNHFAMGFVTQEGRFAAEHLARSPFFGVASVPLLDAGGKLDEFQLFNAAVGAAAWLPIVEHVRRAADRVTWQVRAAALLALALSPVVTVVLQNLWPKFLTGGFFWLALDRLGDWRRRGQSGVPWASATWFAAAVLAHEATLFCAPLLLAIGLKMPARPAWGELRKLFLALLGSGILVALWEAWTVWRFGLDARTAANPAVTWDSGASFGVKFVANFFGFLIGFLPLDLFTVYAETGKGLADKLYYTVIAVVSSMGANAVGVGSIWFLSLRSAIAGIVRDAIRSTRGQACAVAALLIVVANACVLGTTPRYGALQGGLIPLLMCIAGWGIARLQVTDAVAVRRLLACWLALGWVPYVVVGGVVGLILNGPARFAATAEKLRMADADLAAVRLAKWTPLGMQPVVWGVALLAAVGVGCWAWRERARLPVAPTVGHAH